MSQNLYTNQFAQVPIVGDLDLSIMQEGSVAGIISPNAGAAILAGAPIKIDTTITSGYVINFLQAGQDDVGLGFLRRLAKQASFNVLDVCEVTLVGLPVMWMAYVATITPGQAVESNSSGTGVQPLTSHKQRGIALDYGINGSVGRILITNPLAAAS